MEESYNILKQTHTLQIASISSKIMTCNSLWSPVLKNSRLQINKIEILVLKYPNIYSTTITVSPLIILSISKKISHILFSFTNKLAQNFRAIDDLIKLRTCVCMCVREGERKKKVWSDLNIDDGNWQRIRFRAVAFRDHKQIDHWKDVNIDDCKCRKKLCTCKIKNDYAWAQWVFMPPRS